MTTPKTGPWSDVCIVVPTVLNAPGRRTTFCDLLCQLSRECPAAAVRVVPQSWDRLPAPWRSVLPLLAAGLRRTGRSRVLWLEDDVELCTGFGELAGAAVERCVGPRAALSLFSRRTRPPGPHPLGTDLVGCQAVAMPAWLAEAWATVVDPAPPVRYGCPYAIDIALSDLCIERGVCLWEWSPALVQHRPVPSAWGHNFSLTASNYAGKEISNV